MVVIFQITLFRNMLAEGSMRTHFSTSDLILGPGVKGISLQIDTAVGVGKVGYADQISNPS